MKRVESTALFEQKCGNLTYLYFLVEIRSEVQVKLVGSHRTFSFISSRISAKLFAGFHINFLTKFLMRLPVEFTF